MPGRRDDIDGLRAVAVLSVVAFHAFPASVPWGFVGVDVFFVISGYLITAILVEAGRPGASGYGDFYVRRIRRIFPALVVVLWACLAAGWFLLDEEDYGALARHSAAAGAFAANLLLWRESGYFDAAAATKPLLHLWSLGIEEQFYIAWPFLLWFARGRRRTALAICCVLAAASFALGLHQAFEAPVAAFYSPFARAWELLAGGALAMAWSGEGGSRRGADIRSALALALLVVAALTIHERRAFPGAWALLPVGAAMLWISAPGAWLNRRVLAHPVAVAVGLVSYPLYLWHWPLLAFLHLHGGAPPGPTARVAAIAAAFALAWATWRFVEKPLRFGGAGRAKALGLVLAMTFTVSSAIHATDGAPGRFALPVPMERYSLERVADSWRQGACFLWANEGSDALQRCPDRYGPHTILLWGDSHAASLYPGIVALHGQRHAIVQRTSANCPPLPGLVATGPCREINERVLAEARAHRPEVVVLAAAWWATLDYTLLERTLEALREAGVRRIVLVGPPVQWKDRLPRQAFRAMRTHPFAEMPERMGDRVKDGDALEPLLAAIAARHGARFVAPRAILCDDRGCLARQGNEFLMFDESHLTVAGSRLVAPHLPIDSP